MWANQLWKRVARIKCHVHRSINEDAYSTCGHEKVAKQSFVVYMDAFKILLPAACCLLEVRLAVFLPALKLLVAFKLSRGPAS